MTDIKLPHGLKKTLIAPIPSQDAIQFKVEDVIEKESELKFDDIFDKNDNQVRDTSIEDFEARKNADFKVQKRKRKARKTTKKK
tara:strand:- start:7516 stop:7767 length:252 start_codon:yes stop_codon:yes gene_type:complete